MPGRIARPVLVREVRVMETLETKQQYGALLISYASGEGIDPASVDLCITEWPEIKAAGLHKPTRFSLSLADRKLLPWCAEYFVAPDYVKNAGLVLGKLSEPQIARMRDLLRQRGQPA